MRALAALALLALPLAGCTTPAPVGAPAAASLPGPAAAAPAVALPRLAAKDAGEALPCPPQEQRREQDRAHEKVLTIVGCLVASEPEVLGGLPDDIRLAFDVRPGARSLLVLLHLHGDEPLAAWLREPAAGTKLEREDRGTADRDSLLRWELPAPAAGEWDLKGWLEELAMGKRWTATIVVGYA